MVKSDAVSHQDVHASLNWLLACKPFRNSVQCSALLRYIVERSLAGEENLLRERVIGAELFGRPISYETSDDPIVRLRVSEVRKRLAQCYLSEPRQCGVQINIPSGGYRATFERSAVTSTASPVLEAAVEAVEVSVEFCKTTDVPSAHQVDTDTVERGLEQPGSIVATSRKWKRSRAAIMTTIVFLVAVVVLFLRTTPSDRDFRRFWAPWSDGSKPVIISIGSNAVYRVRFEVVDQYSREHGLLNKGQEFFLPFAENGAVPTHDLIPAYHSFVALGDVIAVSSAVEMLTHAGIPYQERFPNDISFAELRSNPSILIGGFNNPMTLELTRQLAFIMRGGNEIVDIFDQRHKWLLDPLHDPPDTADYAIVTRLVQRKGDAPLISVAGLGQYGTRAAAETVCHPKDLHIITDQLPSGWQRRNLQAVLRVGIVDLKPTTLEVVAFRSW